MDDSMEDSMEDSNIDQIVSKFTNEHCTVQSTVYSEKWGKIHAKYMQSNPGMWCTYIPIWVYSLIRDDNGLAIYQRFLSSNYTSFYKDGKDWRWGDIQSIGYNLPIEEERKLVPKVFHPIIDDPAPGKLPHLPVGKEKHPRRPFHVFTLSINTRDKDCMSLYRLQFFEKSSISFRENFEGTLVDIKSELCDIRAILDSNRLPTGMQNFFVAATHLPMYPPPLNLGMHPKDVKRERLTRT